MTGVFPDSAIGSDGSVEFLLVSEFMRARYDVDCSLTVVQQGFVAAMNDLHKGRDTSTLWRWVIDLSGWSLVFLGLSGLGIQFFTRERRRNGIKLAAVGGAATVQPIWFTVVEQNPASPRMGSSKYRYHPSLCRQIRHCRGQPR